MGHLTNPISFRLGKKIWWKDEYLSLSKSIHENFFFYLQSFFDKFLSTFFAKKKRFEYEGIFYFGSKLFVGRKIYLYVFLYDQKVERFRRRRKIKEIPKRKGNKRHLRNLIKGCRKFIGHEVVSTKKQKTI